GWRGEGDGGGRGIARSEAGGGEVIGLGRGAVLERMTVEVVVDIELERVAPLVEGLVTGIDRLAKERGRIIRVLAPLQRGFVAVLELILVTEHNLRPVRQRETQVEPGLAVLQVQIAVQGRRRQTERRVITAGIVE